MENIQHLKIDWNLIKSDLKCMFHKEIFINILYGWGSNHILQLFLLNKPNLLIFKFIQIYMIKLFVQIYMIKLFAHISICEQ